MSSKFDTSDLASPFWVARVTIPSTTADYATVPAPGLIRACADGKTAAWLEFIRRYHRLIAITAGRAARRWSESSPTVVDDLAQETYLKLCDDGARVLRQFDSSHPDAIFGFLKVLTTNVVNDYFKRVHAGKRGGSQAGESLEDVERTAGTAGPSSSESVERTVLLDQVDACLRAVAPADTLERDRTIFWLYYRQGLTAKEIGELPSVGLGVKGVESTLHRLTQLVRAHLEARGTKPGSGEKAYGKGL